MQKREYIRLKSFRIYKRHLTLAYPVIFAQVGQILLSMADNIMIGNVDSVMLAAASFSNNLFINLMAFGLGLSIGLTPLVGTAVGETDHHKVGTILKNGLFINFVLGSIFVLLMYTGSPLMHYMGQDPEVVRLAIPYFQVLSLSMLPLMMFFALKQFNEGLSLAKPSMYVTLVAAVLNIVFNYIFIYGKLGFEPMGLMGAAYSTLLVRILMMLGLVFLSLRIAKFRNNLEFFFQSHISLNNIRNIIKISVPVAVQVTLEGAYFTVGAIMVGWVGAEELAAHQIAIGLAALTHMIAGGISVATTIRVSTQLGKHRLRLMRKAAHAGFHLVILFMCITALTFLFARFWLADLHVDDPNVIEIAASLMVIAALFQLVDGIQVVAFGALRGLKDVKVPTMINLIAYWFIGIPCCYIFAFEFGWGAEGIWYGFLTGLFIAAVLVTIRFEYTCIKFLKSNSRSGL